MSLIGHSGSVGAPVSTVPERVRKRRRTSLGGLLCGLLGLAAPAQAQTLVVCISDEAFPPFTAPGHEAAGQRLIRRAVERQDWQVTFVAMPWRRCLAGVQHGTFSAVAGAAGTAEYLANMAFPLQAGQPDQRRALGVNRLVVYHPRGSQNSWNGQRFSPLTKPVLYHSGHAMLKARLALLGVAADDTARTSEQLARMLIRSRGSLVVDNDEQVKQLFALPEFHGRFELLPQPFGETPVYLAVGLHLYEQHSQLVESVWDEIGVLRRNTARAVPRTETAPSTAEVDSLTDKRWNAGTAQEQRLDVSRSNERPTRL